MNTVLQEGPKAPKDPTIKRPFFFIMQDKDIFGAPQNDGRGIQFIYMDMERLVNAAKIAGNVTDEQILNMLKTAEGFRKLVHSIGVSVSEKSGKDTVRFVMDMYPDKPGNPATRIEKDIVMDGMENIINLSDISWVDTDRTVGQIRFEFDRAKVQAITDVRLYLNDGFVAPEQTIEHSIDIESDDYKQMIQKSIMQTGNSERIERVLSKAGSGNDITLAFIGGSITQGAGAIPINEKSYARIFADEFKDKFAKGGNVNLIKAGVGGTPSELGMIRFERDVLRDGSEKPDLIVIEFAVNDEGDETKGNCYESLVRKALNLSWKPAVVLLFAVFSYDWNLQDRLSPVGVRYNIPMISVKDAVCPQFTLLPQEGRVISKNQFFYDVYHPSNAGHQIMADCLINLFDTVNGYHSIYGNESLEPVNPVIGADFEKVELLDRKEMEKLREKYKITSLSEGSFSDTDKDLQSVEMDSDIFQTPEFPYNWCHLGKTDNEPFIMTLVCSKLLLVFKDSGSITHGKALVYVDGILVKEADPLEVGWTHCNPVILFNNDRSKKHTIEIKMAKGNEDKKFTILGFGIVK
ncbi:MAG: SGNH/GDSL hydrolase family protein [Butyrivibrio sp.]|nr:SGNH/GDSL hydrolase family protein [Butyrivibrio sp.]